MRLRAVSIMTGIAGGAVALAAAVYPASAQLSPARPSPARLSPARLSPAQLSPGLAAPGTITTIAGGIGGPGRPDHIALASPCAVVSDNGVSYFTDQTQQGDTIIRKIADGLDHLTTIMGASTSGVNTDGAPAGRGNPDRSCGVAVDSSGNVLFTEEDIFSPTDSAGPIQDRVRVVALSTGTFYGQQMTGGHVYTIAGNGTAGNSGSGGPAADAELDNPTGLAIDQAGNIAVVDSGNDEIQVIAEKTGTFYGVPMTNGDIYRVAGDGIRGYSGDAGPATEAQLALGSVVRIDRSGNLLISDDLNHVVRAVPTRSGTYYGRAMLAGHIYTIVGTPSPSATSCQQAGSAGLSLKARICPTGVAVDRPGNVVIASHGAVWVAAFAKGDFYGRPMVPGRIYEVVKPGTIRVPGSVSVDGQGNALLAVFGREGLSGALYLLANHDNHDFGLKVQAGHVYRVGGNGSLNYSGDGGSALVAQFGGDAPQRADGGMPSIAVDPQGNIVLADNANARLRVVARSTGTFYGQHMVKGDIYTIAGTGSPTSSHRDTGPAIGAAVEPAGIAADKAGDLAVSGPVGGQGLLWLYAGRTGNRFGRHLVSGHIYVLLRCTSGERDCQAPEDTVFDQDGNLITPSMYSAKGQLHSQTIVIAARTGTFYGRKMIAGHSYVLVPQHLTDSIAVDHDGNLLLGVPYTITVWARTSGTFYGRTMQAHHLYTIFDNPDHFIQILPPGLVVDSAGNVVFAQPGPARIHVIAAATGTFYGVPMTAGGGYTIAGTGRLGFSGDGGPAVKAQLGLATGLALAPDGDLLIADLFRIRSISP